MAQVIACIPLAVAVTVKGNAHIVTSRLDVENLKRAIFHSNRAFHLLAAAQQLNKRAILDIDAEIDIGIFLQAVHLQILLQRGIRQAIDRCHGGAVDS